MPRPASQLLPGERFGRLVVIKRAGSIDKRAMWHCQCDCGERSIVASGALISGRTKSCGCWRREMPGATKTTHGKTVGGHHRIYRIWGSMRTRCNNPNATNYERYGGRGIRVCDEWNASFEAFYRDMGDPPTARHSLDRIDNDGNYEPGNVRWALPIEQRANARPRGPFRAPKTTSHKGEIHHNAKLDADAVRAIRASRERLEILTERYGVSIATIKSVRYRRTWKHVT